MADNLADELGIEGGRQKDAGSGDEVSTAETATEFFISQKNYFRVSVSKTKDLVEDRYQVQGKESIPTLGSEFAKAYHVIDLKQKDNTELYCLVYDRRYPTRLAAMNRLMGEQQKGFANVLAMQMVPLSFQSGNAIVVVLAKPQGRPLIDFLKHHGPCDEEFIVSQFVPQINAVLIFLHQKKVVHGGINLHTIFIDDKYSVYVDECVSEPCGFSQHVLYEELGRADCHPMGKGEGDPSADYYALGIVVNLMLLGGNPLAKIDAEELLRMKYVQGTYTLLSRGMQFSPHMLDMLRGTINDQHKEVWQATQIIEWTKGRRFNLLPHASHTEATRSLEFNGKPYINRKHLAHALSKNWDKAKIFLREDKLVKWVERSMQNHELSDLLKMIQSRAKMEVVYDGFDGGDLLVLETLLMLDPSGPLRVKGTTMLVDGVGSLLAYAFAHDNKEIKRTIGYILSHSVVSEWSNISSMLQESGYQEILFSLEKAADMVEKKGFGFGLERCLYELNPTLSCQSSIVYNECILSVPQLLAYLDNVPEIEGNLLDKQVAAFVSCRTELPSPVRIKSLTRFPDLANNIHIQSLALYSLAQQRSKVKKLSGLAEKLHTNLEEIIELFHSKSIRKEIYDQIRSPVKEGMLFKILQVITNVNYVVRDKAGFIKAKKEYMLHAQQLISLSNKKAIANVGYRYGLQLAVVLSFLIASIVTLSLIIKSF